MKRMTECHFESSSEKSPENSSGGMSRIRDILKKKDNKDSYCIEMTEDIKHCKKNSKYIVRNRCICIYFSVPINFSALHMAVGGFRVGISVPRV